MTDLRYPIGEFERLESLGNNERETHIRNIAAAPARLRLAIAGLNKDQMNTPYRPGGWTVTQVVHHLADSHLNAYIRFKLALTEDQPLIKTYQEHLWAELHDAIHAPIETSLSLMESLHTRWVMLLRSMPPSDFERKFTHPDSGVMKLHMLLQLYSWHGRHHTTQITSLRERSGW